MTQLLLRRGRLMVYCSAMWTAASIYVAAGSPTDSSLRYLIITEYYAIAAASLVYVALFIGPLATVVPDLPGLQVMFRLRRSFGVSAFLFAALHAGFAFFRVIGGISGLALLGQATLAALVLGATALTCLAFLAATSFNAAVRLLGPNQWRKLHRVIHVAGLLIVAHALLVPGAHFRNIEQPSYQLALIAVVVMVGLQAARIYTNRSKRGEAR